jgi:hypothetical protein
MVNGPGPLSEAREFIQAIAVFVGPNIVPLACPA